MDSALEDLERGVGPVPALRPGLHGHRLRSTTSHPQVDCTWVGGRFNVGDLFAVVMTGAGAGRTGPLLTVTNGGNSANAEKIFEGPVYMAGTPTASGADPTMDFSATLAVKNADLSYSAVGLRQRDSVAAEPVDDHAGRLRHPVLPGAVGRS